MDEPLILVTGSTGKTGTPVVRLLRERGHPIRALVRRLDERAGRLKELGAETVVGDYHDLSSIRDAMKGVRRVYFCYPPQGAGCCRPRPMLRSRRATRASAGS